MGGSAPPEQYGTYTLWVPTPTLEYSILISHIPPLTCQRGMALYPPCQTKKVPIILPRSSRGSMKNTLSYSPGLAGGVWKIHYHTPPVQPGEYEKVPWIRQPEKEWHTSNKRSGQPGFSFPSGCPLGLLAALAYGPRDIPRGKKTQAVPPSCWRYIPYLRYKYGPSFLKHSGEIKMWMTNIGINES